MKLLNLYGIAVLALALYQCGRSSEHSEQVIEKPVAVLDSATIKAKKTYQMYCSGCHGQQMEAFADRKWRHGKHLDSIKASITNGYSDGGMPAWGASFTEEEIDNLAQYIRGGIEQVEKYGFEKETLESDTFQLDGMTVHLDTVFSGIEVPWHMTWLPNGDMLVTDRTGDLYRVDEAGNKVKIKGVPPVRTNDQDGLFEIKLHPDFASNQYVFMTYSDLKITDGDSTTTTVMSRFTLKNDELIEKKVYLAALPYTSKQYHFGGRMVFDKGYVYVTIGDRAERDVNPQDLTKIPGKIHRFNLDGSIPEDNPFVNEPGAVKSIWSYGHRNPQGLTINPTTGALWQHEHGPRGGDEINIIEPGKNYGWPVISYGINYDGTIFTSKLEKDGMAQPLHYWVPSIAPCGMAWVTSDKYPAWKGDLLVGSLRFEYLNRCEIEGDKVIKEEEMLKGIGRLRNVEQGPDGYIYVSVEKPGYIFRLVPIK